MTELRANLLIVFVAMVVISVAMLGSAALGANGSTIAIGAFFPAIVAAYLISRVVMHYGDESDERERLRR